MQDSSDERKYIHVRVLTRAKKEGITEKKGAFHVSVKEKAERGLANKRVKELLAQAIGCSIKSLRIIKGSQSPSKTYQLLSNTK